MNRGTRDYWFAAKSHGIGWGMPVKWQGWVVLIGYLVLMVGGIQYFRLHLDVRSLLIHEITITVLLIVVMYLKGQRPVKWRWGSDST